MNLDPTAGDRWTLSGHDDLIVKQVSGNVVKLNRGEPTDIPTYLIMARASIQRGATLHRNGQQWSKEIEEYEI